MNKIMSCCLKLEEWGGGPICELKVRMENYRKEMQKYRSRRDKFGIQKYDTTQWQFMRLLEKQKIFCWQRAKQFWLRDGDKNTRFFDKFASTRKEHNKIKKLKDKHAKWKETNAEIQEVITEYFKDMFNSASTGMSLPARVGLPIILELRSHFLVRPIADEEVKNAVFAMHSDKAPGVDGLNPGFYQAYWEIVRRDVIEFCINFFKLESYQMV